MQNSMLSQELINILAERDSLLKLMKLADVCKEITDIAPFEKDWDYLLKDKTLIRFLILGLPFHENVIESVINSQLFKFQCKLDFLISFEENQNVILQLNDPPLNEDELYVNRRETINPKTGNKEEEGSIALGSLIETFFDPEIRFNMLKFKHRCVYYMRKIYYIYETNFGFHKSDEMTPKAIPMEPKTPMHHRIPSEKLESETDQRTLFIDPFRLIYNGILITNSEPFKDELMKECLKYEQNPFYAKSHSRWLENINKNIRNRKAYDDSSHESVEYMDKEFGSIKDDENLVSLSEDEMEQSDSELNKTFSYDEETNVLGIPDVQSDIIHEWMFSEEIPYFSKSDYMRGIITENDSLEIIFKIIISPFSVHLHDMAKQKYRRLLHNLAVDLKQNYPLENDRDRFYYDSHKHNPYYLRARRTLIVFLFKPNITLLMSLNEQYLDVFFKVLYDDVWDNPNCKCNMDYLFKMIQYFQLIDVGRSIRNIIKYHIPFYLLANVEIITARSILDCLLSPGDTFFRVPSLLIKEFYSYLNESDFFETMFMSFSSFSQETIYKKIIHLRKNFQNIDSVALKKLPFFTSKNPFTNIFHSQFNVKLQTKKGKQPEDYCIQKKDIDRINLRVDKTNNSPKKEGRLSTRKGSRQMTGSNIGQNVLSPNIENEMSTKVQQKTSQNLDIAPKSYAIKITNTNFERSNTTGNDEPKDPTSRTYQDLEMIHDIDSEFGEEQLEISTQDRLFKNQHENIKHLTIAGEIVYTQMATGRFKFNKQEGLNPKKLHPKKVGVIKKFYGAVISFIACKRLNFVAHQASVRMEQKRFSAKPFNFFTVNYVYTEQIKLVQSSTVKRIKNQDQYFDKYIKNEAIASHLADLLNSVIKSGIHLARPNLSSILNQPKRDPMMLWNILMRVSSYVIMLFNTFITKINLAIENKAVFKSCVIAGELFNLILKNYDSVTTDKDVRIELLKELKLSIPTLCEFINKSQNIYRRLLKDETMKLAGSMTVIPFTDLRILLTETLFNIISQDTVKKYESLNRVFDSTYHTLFVFAIEKCHNSIYLAKFLEFLKIYFNNASEVSILNVVFRINILSDITGFYKELVYKDCSKKVGREIFLFFFKEVFGLIKIASERKGFTTLQRELSSSQNWTNYESLINDNIFDAEAILCDPSTFLGKNYKNDFQIKSNVNYLINKPRNVEDVKKQGSVIKVTRTNNSGRKRSDSIKMDQGNSNTLLPENAELKKYKKLLSGRVSVTAEMAQNIMLKLNTINEIKSDNNNIKPRRQTSIKKEKVVERNDFRPFKIEYEKSTTGQGQMHPKLDIRSICPPDDNSQDSLLFKKSGNI